MQIIMNTLHHLKVMIESLLMIILHIALTLKSSMNEISRIALMEQSRHRNYKQNEAKDASVLL